MTESKPAEATEAPAAPAAASPVKANEPDPAAEAAPEPAAAEAAPEPAPEPVIPAPVLVLTSPSSNPEQEKPQAAHGDSVYTRDGLLGPVRVGPSVGAGAPDGMRFSLFATYKGLVTGGGALSFVPTVGIPGAEPAQIGRFTGEGFVRLHPFRGAFFAGVAAGVSQTQGTTSGLAIAGVEQSRVDIKAKTNVMFVSPHLGFRWMLPFGMTAGFDAGVEIPVVPGTPEFDASHDGQSIDNVPGKAKIDSALRFASHTVVPTLHLIELGYAF